LVCQPEEDEMTPAYFTKKIFKKLKSKQKKVPSFNGAVIDLPES